MDSPETDRIPPSPSQSPAFEDSPFTNFMCTLSPIKPSKRAHVGRLFSEINLPPPTPVFTSPRINPQRETCFLKRPQYLVLPDAELSLEYDDRGKILAVGSDVCQPSASQPTAVLDPCTLESCEKENSLQVDPCSPSESVDAFLADPLEECANATDSPDLPSDKTTDPPQLLQSGCNSSKETISELVDKESDDVREDTQSKVAAKASLSEHAKEDLVCTKPLDHVKSLDTNDNLKPASGAEGKNNQKLCTEHQLSASANVKTGPLSDSAFGEGHGLHLTISDSASLSSIDKEHENVESEKEMPANSSDLCKHGTQDVKMHLVNGGQQDDGSHTVQDLPGSSLNVQADVILHDSSAFNTTTDNQASHEFEEASQHQFGMRRRLQFESFVNRRKNAQGSNICNAPNSVFNAMSPTSPSNAKSKLACTSKQALNLSGDALPRSTFQPFKTLQPPINKIDSSARSSGNSPTTTPMPSSIGLHLNSIGNTIAVSSRIKTQFAEKDSLNVKVEKPPSGSSSHLLQDSMGCPGPASLAGNSLSGLTAKVDSSLASVEGNDVEQQENQGSAMASPLTSFQNSAQNMKTLSNSLQLQLTGQQGIPCENKMPTQDTSMFEELNQMSPRKKRKRDSYSNEDVGCKRCNCKKSKCLKLYCDCFAAGVYCAEPCACQDCFNKPEYEGTVLGTRQQIESRNPLAFAPKIVLRASDSPLINGGDGHLTTPASARHKRGCNCKKSRCLKKYCECYQAGVGCSAGCRCEGCKNIFGKKDGCGESMEMEHRKAADERWHEVSDRKLVLEVKSHLEKSHVDSLSPLTPLHQCSEKSPRSPRNSKGSRAVTAKELNVGPVSHDHELDCHKGGQVNPFSLRWDGLARISDIGSFEQHPHSRATASSVTDVQHNSKDMQARLSGGVCLSVSPLRWNGSPVTPATHFRGSKFIMDADSDNRLYNIPEDDTPDILKETHSPIKAVKASSPNQKRVSPPHNCLHESKRSSSSPGLRSGRKFILQSVPSFPPLTPYSDPKGSEK